MLGVGSSLLIASISSEEDLLDLRHSLEEYYTFNFPFDWVLFIRREYFSFGLAITFRLRERFILGHGYGSTTFWVLCYLFGFLICIRNKKWGNLPYLPRIGGFRNCIIVWIGVLACSASFLRLKLVTVNFFPLTDIV